MASLLSHNSAGDRLTRIVVTGSESTGKTLLAQQLAEHYAVAWVREFARDYAEEKHTPLTADDVDPIGRGQVAREDAAVHKAHDLLILDTDLLSTLVYGEQYYGIAPEWIPGAVKLRLADLYLLCDIDVPWVADSVRDAQHQRRSMHDAFLQRLKAFGAPFRLITGTPSERLATAIESIDAVRLLSSS
ncbi:MAG: ATP-binding protein [Gemmatimonadota bacterium]